MKLLKQKVKICHRRKNYLEYCMTIRAGLYSNKMFHEQGLHETDGLIEKLDGDNFQSIQIYKIAYMN